MELALVILLSYLIGSISPSTLITRWIKKTDIRQHGSGNAGATNTMRVLGIKWALVVLALDILKGIIAVLIAEHLKPGDHWFTYLAAIAVILGHNWPVFFQFRGGKGIATTIGVLLLIMVKPALIAGGCAILILVLMRYVSLAALIFTVFTPIVALFFRADVVTIIFAAFIACLSLYRHKANIQRLIRGEESRVFSRKASK